MTVIEKITQELEVFNQKKKDLTEDLRKEFPTLFQDLFAQSKRIESFSWTQYTPYFNDGESCEFGVNQDYLYVNGENVEDLDEEEDFLNESTYKRVDGEYKKVPNPLYDPKEGEVFQAIKTILNTVPDEFYEELFGDHVKVTVYKDGKIETEDYRHD
jgi:molybdopterin converting factor small subunit